MTADHIKKKFEWVKSDIDNNDWTSLPTLQDVESLACECIVKTYKHEGCNLLASFTRLLVRGNSAMGVREFLMHLDDAKKVLT